MVTTSQNCQRECGTSRTRTIGTVVRPIVCILSHACSTRPAEIIALDGGGNSRLDDRDGDLIGQLDAR